MTMRERITAAVSARLAIAAETETKYEIIEELSGNLYSKYEDLVRSGTDPEEAYETAMDSLGDVSELITLAGGTRTKAEFEKMMGSVMGAMKDVAQDLKEPFKEMMDDICHVASAAKEPLKDVGRAIAGAVKDLAEQAPAADVQDADVEPVEDAAAAAEDEAPETGTGTKDE